MYHWKWNRRPDCFRILTLIKSIQFNYNFQQVDVHHYFGVVIEISPGKAPMTNPTYNNISTNPTDIKISDTRTAFYEFILMPCSWCQTRITKLHFKITNKSIITLIKLRKFQKIFSFLFSSSQLDSWICKVHNFRRIFLIGNKMKEFSLCLTVHRVLCSMKWQPCNVS
jgi:hypothetical protein